MVQKLLSQGLFASFMHECAQPTAGITSAWGVGCVWAERVISGRESSPCEHVGLLFKATWHSGCGASCKDLMEINSAECSPFDVTCRVLGRWPGSFADA